MYKLSKSEKIASELEKLALRAWKVNIGKIGPKGKEVLFNHGILDFEKEMKGLNTGTDKIIARHGGKVTHFNEDELVEHVRKSMHEDPLYAKLHKDGEINIDKAAEGARTGFASSGGNATFTLGKQPIVNRGTTPSVLHTGNKGMDDYTMAITNRHEADELRYTQLAHNSPKKHVDILGTRMSLTTFDNKAHSSPKVITQESAHAAIAPPPIKSNFTRFRTDTGRSEQSLIQESDPSFAYGYSGKVDTNAGVKAENAYIKKNKPDLVAYKKQIE